MKGLVLVLVAAAAAALVSCSSSDGGPSQPDDTTAPTVGAWNLADGATDVGLIKQLAITFSEDMDESTISDTTVYVEGRALGGFVDYDAGTRTATYTPDTLYAGGSWYDITVDGPTDEAGNPLEPVTRSFQTGTLDCEHLEDYLEPNDSFGAPSNVSLDHLYPTLAICGTDQDYFSFTLDEPSKVTVHSHFVHADTTDWYVQFFRHDGGQYCGQSTGEYTGHDRLFGYSFSPGTYLVSIDSQADPEYVLYDVEFETSDPCDDDDYEDNDFVDEAEPLSVNETHDLVGCYLDADVFSFYAESGQTITLTSVWAGPQASIAALTVYGPGGFLLGSHVEYGLADTIQVTAEETGTHYAEAKFWNERTEYEFRIDVGP